MSGYEFESYLHQYASIFAPEPRMLGNRSPIRCDRWIEGYIARQVTRFGSDFVNTSLCLAVIERKLRRMLRYQLKLH